MGFKDSFYPKPHCESREKLFLHQSMLMWLGLRMRYSCLYTSILAVCKTAPIPVIVVRLLCVIQCLTGGLSQALLLSLFYCAHL